MMGMYGIPLKGFERLDKWETKILVYEGLRNSGTKIKMELEYKVQLTVRKYYGQDTEFGESMVLETSSYALREVGELAFIRKPYGLQDDVDKQTENVTLYIKSHEPN
jgi:hypothetical protein